jgi:hypothetical protein
VAVSSTRARASIKDRSQVEPLNLSVVLFSQSASSACPLTFTYHGCPETSRVRDDAKSGQTIKLLLEATDDGTPALTRYQRVVVTVA